MMGTNGQVWPRCAEFDIMEFMCNSSNYNTINSTLHWYDESAGVDKGVNYGLATTVNNPTDWHVYTMEWTPTTVRTYIDGVEFYAADIITTLYILGGKHYEPRYELQYLL
jgi:beta-glucanase (GH16 family)